jgi:hypothetical protein
LAALFATLGGCDVLSKKNPNVATSALRRLASRETRPGRMGGAPGLGEWPSGVTSSQVSTMIATVRNTATITNAPMI